METVTYSERVVSREGQMISSNLVATVQSQTSEGRSYEIRKGKDGTIYCSCPAWKFQRKPASQRDCKHLKALRQTVSRRRAA